MAALDVVAIPSDSRYVTFTDLRVGRSSQVIVGRLLRFWDARNVKQDGEFMGIVLLLLDEKTSVIHGFIPAVRADQFRHILREGLIFQLGGFEVGRCTNLYKITDHPFVIRFLPTTTIHEVQAAGIAIEHQKFMLRKHEHLQALANTNLELPDVVGQIRFVQGSNLKDATSTQRVVVRFQIDVSVTVSLSLWDDAAATFRAHLSSEGSMNSIMLVTTVNPKLFGGNLFLNSTPATRFFFDPKINAIEEFMKSVGAEAGRGFSQGETSEGVEKKEMLTIKELHTYISQPNHQIPDADFICKARVVEIQEKNGWSYVSCANCNRKLEKHGNALRCTKCVSPNVTGVVRYRVELAVHDGEDGATFVVFDTEMTKLINKTAATLTIEAAGEDRSLPTNLQDLAGKHFLFQIRVSPFNFTPQHRTFTVSKINHAPTPIAVEEGPYTAQVGVHVPTTTSIGNDNGTLDAVEGKKAETSETGQIEKSRKRGRE